VDITPFLDLRPAPCAVLDALDARADLPRFHERDAAGAWQPTTWAAFAAEIRAVAAWLIGRGIGAGDRVAVYGQNSTAWAAAALGAQAAGCVLVPVYPATPADGLAYVLGHGGVRALFAGGDTELARMGAVRADLPALGPVATLDRRGGAGLASWSDVTGDGGARDRRDPDLVSRRLATTALDQPALMLYTSGTSGPPKGVPLSHRNIGANAADWLTVNAPLLEVGARDLLWLPMSHIFGLGELCMGNALGWESYLSTPADVMADLPEVAPEVFMSVPVYWEKIARAGAGPAVTGGRLRFCLSGGAGLKVEIKQRLLDAGVLVIEGYGLTETSPTLTLNRADAYRFDTVGKPLPSVELRLDDDGEILARGPNVFAGYHDDPDATRAAFTDDGWFRTGDVGRFTDDGFLQIIDRKKDILVTAGGKNVPPANIEARFAGDPVIERVVVFGDGKPYLVAAVWTHPSVPLPEREAAVAARIAAVNAQLARFETIKRFALVDDPLTVEGGMLTSSLKLRRKAVVQALAPRLEALYT
jgi:long-chain acyl-CoA synthetase